MGASSSNRNPTLTPQIQETNKQMSQRDPQGRPQGIPGEIPQGIPMGTPWAIFWGGPQQKIGLGRGMREDRTEETMEAP